jgi:hypothetical protein
MARSNLSRALAAAAFCTAALASPSLGAAQTKRIQLNVLVLSAGDTGTEMVRAGLDEGLVPYTVVDLNAAGRPVINAAFLADNPSSNVRRAKFQAVVLPSEAPSQLSQAERAALAAFEREFKVRQLDTYVYPSPAVGLNWPGNPGYIGALDGMTGTVNAAGKAAGFGYLAGPLPVEDVSQSVLESYGYLSTPLPADTVNKRSFTTFVDMPIPGAGTNGVLVGVYTDNGREELVITGSMNQYQLQQQLLFPGILNWLTYGVHLGTERNYLAVQVDDVFLPDARWSSANNCTVGDDCPTTVTAPDILMTPADVDYLVTWQRTNGLKLDMVFNGGGYDAAVQANGSYPLGTRLLQNRSQFRWINHTYTHLNLGCIKDFSVTPWRCATSAGGAVQWVSYADAYDQINKNIQFAFWNGISIRNNELVTGEHSGLRRTPQEPSDNPNLVRALNALNIRWAGSDNSREPVQRAVGEATTVPRYPMNIYYNTGTRAEAVDEYNWIYNSAANGGSGLCESNPASTCITPLDPATGFDTYILPNEARVTLSHVLANSPRPHYAHQSNLAEDRILYPVIDRTLASYKSYFATTAPIVNPTHTEAGTEIARQRAWTTDRTRVSGYIQGGSLVLTGGSLLTSITTPLTLPSGAGGSLSTYGVNKTGWLNVGGLLSTNITLPTSVAYAR